MPSRSGGAGLPPGTATSRHGIPYPDSPSSASAPAGSRPAGMSSRNTTGVGRPTTSAPAGSGGTGNAPLAVAGVDPSPTTTTTTATAITRDATQPGAVPRRRRAGGGQGTAGDMAGSRAR